MELHHHKLKLERRFLVSVSRMDDDGPHSSPTLEVRQDVSTVEVLRAYLPANLVAQAESNIAAQREKEQGK